MQRETAAELARVSVHFLRPAAVLHAVARLSDFIRHTGRLAG